RRWLIAFGFGLVHGFGFSFALRETLQFAGSHLLTSLVAFNIGVELGQLLVLALAVPAFGLLFRFVVAERVGTIIVSALVVHTAWHWLGERADQLRRHRFEWPAFDLLLLVGLVRWLILAVLVACAAWLVFGVFGPQIIGSRKREDRLAG
ncbi:MAG: HupE/UreJ family protein, partial [Vicinamibacterales bacterium]